jgi:hypothetical protein
MEQLDSTKLQNEFAALGNEIKGFFHRSESFQNAMAYMKALSFSPLSTKLLDPVRNCWPSEPSGLSTFITDVSMGS